MPNVVYGAQSIYSGGKMHLTVVDPVTGDTIDIFTPGMAGTFINVSGSQNPLNDGFFMITEYEVACTVVLGLSPSTTSDTTAQATIRF